MLKEIETGETSPDYRMRLVGDVKQLHAVAYGDVFEQVARRTEVASLTEIRRQEVDWQREASEELSRHEFGILGAVDSVKMSRHTATRQARC